MQLLHQAEHPPILFTSAGIALSKFHLIYFFIIFQHLLVSHIYFILICLLIFFYLLYLFFNQRLILERFQMIELTYSLLLTVALYFAIYLTLLYIFLIKERVKSRDKLTHSNTILSNRTFRIYILTFPLYSYLLYLISLIYTIITSVIQLMCQLEVV